MLEVLQVCQTFSARTSVTRALTVAIVVNAAFAGSTVTFP
jgi:hypothetical protein